MGQRRDSGSPPGAIGHPARELNQTRHDMQAAVALQRQGRLPEAISAYRKLLRRHPEIPEAHNNLGVALKATGDLPGATASFERAIKAAPNYGMAYGNLASAFAARGLYQEALRRYLEALRLEPERAAHRQGLATVLPQLRFSEAGHGLAQAVESCFSDPGIEHQTLVPAAVSLLKCDPKIRAAFESCAGNGETSRVIEIAAGAFDQLAKNNLLHAILTRAIVADEEFERLLTFIRRLFLAAVTDDDSAGLEVPLLKDSDFAAALACQCFLNDYAYPETDDEAAGVLILSSASTDGTTGTSLSQALIVFAMYRPLHELQAAADIARLVEDLPPAHALLLRRQLLEPSAERKLAQKIPSLTAVSDATSLAVRRQYEESPYPRWLSTRQKQPQPLAQVVHGLFPQIDAPEQKKPVRILIAGCGTGKHAVDVATRYAECEVLAIDLSLTSLAYGARQADERGLDNLRFAQADILGLGDLEERFDLIESVGVLHHLQDPMAGWRILAGLLIPGGFMRLGFYSTKARAHIRAARAFIEAKGFAADPAGIRAARQEIFALDPDDPARRVTGELDFYSLTGCRDLLFNVQEATFALTEIQQGMDDLCLEFLGFEFHDPALKDAYAKRYPEDPQMRDLARWDRLETEAPDAFRQMYQFWCRKP